MAYNLTMDSKRTIYFFMFIGGTIGGYVPLLWGGEAFSFAGIIFNALGALLGIYLGFKMTR